MRLTDHSESLDAITCLITIFITRLLNMIDVCLRLESRHKLSIFIHNSQSVNSFVPYMNDKCTVYKSCTAHEPYFNIWS